MWETKLWVFQLNINEQTHNIQYEIIDNSDSQLFSFLMCDNFV